MADLIGRGECERCGSDDVDLFRYRKQGVGEETEDICDPCASLVGRSHDGSVLNHAIVANLIIKALRGSKKPVAGGAVRGPNGEETVEAWITFNLPELEKYSVEEQGAFIEAEVRARVSMIQDLIVEAKSKPKPTWS